MNFPKWLLKLFHFNVAKPLVEHPKPHYNDVTMSAKASQITSLMIVYSTVYSGADQIKHQSSASRAFVRGIHRWPVNSPHKGPVTRKMFPFDDIIMSHPLDHWTLNRIHSSLTMSSRFCAMFYSPWWTIFSCNGSLLFFNCQNLKHFSCLCDCHSRNFLVTMKRFFSINNHWVFAKSPLHITTLK